MDNIGLFLYELHYTGLRMILIVFIYQKLDDYSISKLETVLI